MSILFPNKNRTKEITEIRVHMDDDAAINEICDGLTNLLENIQTYPLRQILFVCIGTDRSTGDCLGPLIGTQLMQRPKINFPVYGTLDTPVHASNLSEFLEIINNKYQNPIIIAIDACLGKLDSIGYIAIKKGSLKPGAGVNKNLPPVGDVHITGVVNVGGFMEYFVLQNTRLSVVMKMATIISEGIEKACCGIKNTRSQ